MSLKHWFKVQTPPLAYYALIKLAFGSFACTWSLAEFLPHSDSGGVVSPLWRICHPFSCPDFDSKNHSQSWLAESLMEGRTIMPCQCLWVSCYPSQLSNWPGDQLDSFCVLSFLFVLFPSLPFPFRVSPPVWCSQYITLTKIIFLTSKFSYLLLLQPQPIKLKIGENY
jgi:hypothetical protein